MYRMCRLLVQIKCTGVKDVSIQWNLHAFTTQLIYCVDISLFDQSTWTLDSFTADFIWSLIFHFGRFFKASFGFIVIVSSIGIIQFKEILQWSSIIIELNQLLVLKFSISYCIWM